MARLRPLRTLEADDNTQWRGTLPDPVMADVVVAQSYQPSRRSVSSATSYRVSAPRAVQPAMTRAAEAPAEEEEKVDPGQYRLSELPADVVAAVAVAQAFAAQRPQSQTMQVVEIASSIAGAVMTRVLDNTGDVSWELDQMSGSAVHPDGATSTPSTAPWQKRSLTIPGPKTTNGLGQDTFADFEVNFSYNGASVGFVEVSTVHAEDGWAWGLIVKETMLQDPQTYTTSPPSAQRFAALKLRFHHRFDHTPLQDVIAIQDVTIYGSGTYSSSVRWTQP